MDWTKGYTAGYRLAVMNKKTWREIDNIEVISGTVTKTTEGLRETAQVTVTDWPYETEQWVRLVLETKQGDTIERWPVFTGLATAPSISYDGGRKTVALECYSGLKSLEDYILPRGWYAPAGADIGQVLSKLFEKTPAPFSYIQPAPVLSESIVAEEGETAQTVADKILGATSWRLRVSGDGAIRLEPACRSPVITLDPVNADIIEPAIDVTADWYSAPNVFIATTDTTVGVAKDETGGRLSIEARGREVIKEEHVEATGIDVSIVARQKLEEAQAVEQTARYNRRYWNGVYPGDIIALAYPDQGLTGWYRVTAQTVTCSHAGRTSEEVELCKRS